MRWVSFRADEFAFLSVSGQAKGIIAIGGMAHGVIAIGGFLSVGVVSIGMNAIGSVAAFGMNAVAPISVSLINALGIYVFAGTNGCGTWTSAGVNATGWASARGGTNSDRSIIPTVVMFVVLIAASSVFRGARTPRGLGHFTRLSRFVRSAERRAAVRARLLSVGDDALELADRDDKLDIACSDRSLIESARKLITASGPDAPDVIVALERFDETVLVGVEADYRKRPAETKETVIRCLSVTAAPEPIGWLPKDVNEVQWLVSWSARFAVVVIVLALFLFR